MYKRQGETVAVAHVEPSKSVVIDNDVVGATEQQAQGSDDSRVGRRTVPDCITMSDEVTIMGDASITDDEIVVVGDATVADKSTTDGDRRVVERGESVIVNAMSDELTTVDSSATDDVSGRNEVTGTIFSNDTMSLDQI